MAKITRTARRLALSAVLLLGIGAVSCGDAQSSDGAEGGAGGEPSGSGGAGAGAGAEAAGAGTAGGVGVVHECEALPPASNAGPLPACVPQLPGFPLVPGGVLVEAMVTADFDGDGNADIATFSPPDVNVHFGTGHGTFGALATYDVGPGSELAGSDLDGDGNVDLLVSGDGLTVLENAGDGTFSIALTDPTVSYAELGDFDGDGAPDLIAADFRENLFTLLNDGSGSFGEPLEVNATAPEAGQVAVGDLDGDGRVDVLLGATPPTILFGFGDGTFFSLGEAGGASVGNWPILVDVDADGSLDIVYRGGVWRNDGRAIFAERTTFVAGPSDGPVVVRDLNCDGLPDLIASNRLDDLLYVLMNEGGGNFGDPEIYAGQWPVAVNDVNGDGRPDLLTSWSYRSFTSILPGNGDGTFLVPGGYGFPDENPSAGPYAYASDMAASDLNGDGALDFALINTYGSGTSGGERSIRMWLEVLLGDGAMGFEEAAKRYELPRDGPYFGIAAADLTGDGGVDLGVIHGAAIHVFESRGSGVFLDPLRVDAPAALTSVHVAAADLDGDADVDLVTTGSAGVSVLFNEGDGVFADPVSYDTALPLALLLGDVDGDGDVDIAIVDGGDEPIVRVLFNEGDGAFSPFVDLPAAERPYAIALRDVDGDGKDDLLTGGGRVVRVLREYEDGAFASDETYTSGAPGALALMAEDMDGDGALDIVTASLELVEIMPGRGDGTFGDAFTYAAPDGSSHMVIADLDGDDMMDVATDGATLTLLKNRGCLP